MELAPDNITENAKESAFPQAVADDFYSAGYSLYCNGKYQEALSFFEVLTMKQPKEIKHWMGLGATYQMLKQYKEAIAIYATAGLIDNKHTNPYLHLHAAECFFSINDSNNGLSALDFAVKVAADQPKFNDVISRASALREAWK